MIGKMQMQKSYFNFVIRMKTLLHSIQVLQSSVFRINFSPPYFVYILNGTFLLMMIIICEDSIRPSLRAKRSNPLIYALNPIKKWIPLAFERDCFAALAVTFVACPSLRVKHLWRGCPIRAFPINQNWFVFHFPVSY